MPAFAFSRVGWSVALTLFFTLTALSTCAAQSRTNLLQGNPLRGRELFVSKGCLECHSIRGVGGTVGPDLGLKVFHRSVHEIAGILWNHSPFMSRKMAQMGIRRPEFNARELLDLISFLYFLNYFDPPGNTQIGRQLWVEKACSTCHSDGVDGDKPGPRLDRIQSPPTSVFLAQSMWNHGSKMLEMFRLLDIEPPRFADTEMVDLAAYIRQMNRNPRPQLFSLGDPGRGKALFRSKGCGSCHSPGGSSQAPSLSDSRFQASVSQIAGQMWNHLPIMHARMRERGVAFPTFSGEEMNHLISYLYSLAYIGMPGQARNGATVYREKGCIQCHGEPGREQKRIGPDLAQADLDTPLGAVPTMWNHALKMQGKMAEEGIVWPRFRGSEMADLQAYLKSKSATKNR